MGATGTSPERSRAGAPDPSVVTEAAGRRVLVASIAVVSADGLLFSLIAPAVPRLADRFDLSATEVAFIFAAFPAAMVATALVGGRFVDRMGRRRAMFVGGLLLVVATLAFPLAQDAWGLLIARALQGAGGGFAWTAALAAVAAASPPDRRGGRMAALESAAGGSGLVGPVIGGVAFDAVGVLWTFVGAAVVAALALVPVARSREVGERSMRIADRTALLAVLRRPVALAASVATLVAGAALALLEPLLPLDLDDRLGLASTGIGIVFAAGSAAYLVSAPIMGRVSDRRGSRLPVVGGLVLAGIAFPFLGFGPAWFVAAAFVVLGVGLGSAMGPTGALVSRGVDEAGLEGAYALGGALIVLLFAVGYLLGPVTGGIASLGLPFVAITGLAGAGTLAGALVCARYLPAR